MQYLFFAAVIGILGSFPILLFVAIRKQPLSMITRSLLAFLVLAPVPFCFWISCKLRTGNSLGVASWLWRIFTPGPPSQR